MPATAYAQLESEARAYLQSIANYLRPHARAVYTKLVVADPSEAILNAATAQRADLIAMWFVPETKSPVTLLEVDIAVTEPPVAIVDS